MKIDILELSNPLKFFFPTPKNPEKSTSTITADVDEESSVQNGASYFRTFGLQSDNCVSGLSLQQSPTNKA